MAAGISAAMLNSTVLDVAIGLVFVYILLGLVVTTLGEMIEASLKQRGRELERGIIELLRTEFETEANRTSALQGVFPRAFAAFARGTSTFARWFAGPGPANAVKTADTAVGQAEKAVAQAGDYVSRLYTHPLIASLYRGHYAPGSKELPSYIPRRNFALALMAIIAPPQGAPSRADGATDATKAADAAVDAQAEQGGDVAPPPVATATPATKNDPLDPERVAFRHLRDAVDRIENAPRLRGALLPLIDAAGGDVAQARRNIEDWYDGTMDRVSGWYKRHAQRIAILLSLTVTIVMNVDSVAIARSLSRDTKMREVLVEAAQAKANASAIYGVDTANAMVSPDDHTEVGQAKRRLAQTVQDVNDLGLPVGWRTDDPRLVPHQVGEWLSKLFGWLLTAIAVSLGAPFWFETLNKIMVVRSTVKPKEKSPNEPPVDRA